MSLADQSFNKTSPKMRSSAESIFNGSPRLFAGPPRNAPTSSSISSLFVAINEGFSAVGALVYLHIKATIKIPPWSSDICPTNNY